MEIIAHRGYSTLAPENTLIAFQKALEQGAHSLELDIQLSADGIPVIFHDQNLLRICGISAFLREKTALELQQLDAGKWFSDIYPGETIPTLEKAAQILHRVPNYLYFDVKIKENWTDLNIQVFLNILYQYQLVEQAIITSFNETFLSQCRQQDPQVKLGYFLVNVADYEQQLTKAITAKASILSVYYPVLITAPNIIQRTRDQGIDLIAWTVDDATILQQLYNLNVQRIVSNDLSIFKAL